jgi:hypothetical protein
MENKLENINKILAYRVSPLQSHLNMTGKEDAIESFQYQIWQIWMIPLVLTWTETVFIKHQRIRSANTTALAKFISIPVSIVLSQYFYSQLQHKLHYYDAVYPHAPQTQIEITRDSYLVKQKYK